MLNVDIHVDKGGGTERHDEICPFGKSYGMLNKLRKLNNRCINNEREK